MTVELELALKRIPDDPTLLLQLGSNYIHIQDQTKAVAAIQRAADLDPHASTLNNAAYFLAEANLSLDNALHYAKQSVEETENASQKITLDDLSSDELRIVPTLANEWDTLGWVYFRMGQLDSAERYLSAGWNLTQSPVMADHLGQAYEKQGKQHEAAIAYSRALAAGHAPDETRARLDAIRPGGKYQAGESVDAVALQNLRTLKLDKFPGKPREHTSAEFFLLFAPGPKVVDVKFISGSDELRDAGKILTAANVNILFPDDHPAQILRRGVLDCEPEIPGCVFAFIPPTSVTSVK